MEALHEQLEANQAPRKKMVIATACIAAGTVVDHFGHPWISGVLILVGLWNSPGVHGDQVLAACCPDAHIYPDAYLYPELARGRQLLSRPGEAAVPTPSAWTATPGTSHSPARAGTSPAARYVRMLPHTADGVRVPYPTLHAAIVAVRSLYNDPTPDRPQHLGLPGARPSAWQLPAALRPPPAHPCMTRHADPHGTRRYCTS